MRNVRVGYVRFLNTAPLVQGLDACRDIQAIAAVPSHLIGMLERKEIDIGLVSVIDASSSSVPVTLLPVGMIGCDGPTLTVRLFSSVPLKDITRVHADTDSHTSVALCRVLLSKMLGLTPPVEPYHARERFAPSAAAENLDLDLAWPQTVLLIGDKVVSDPPPESRYPYQLDLGEAWKNLTGLPFVYAMWMCRTEDANDSSIQTAARLLDRQRLHNRTRLDWLVAERAPAHRWPLEVAGNYVGSLLSYEVGPREREACRLFLEMVAELGVAPRRTLEFAAI